MIITVVNVAICGLALVLGIYTFVKHLDGFGRGNTPAVDAWLVSVGTLAWSVWLLDSIQMALMQNSLASDEIGLSVFGNVLLFIYWAGSLLQVQKHCLKLKLRKRKLERVK